MTYVPKLANTTRKLLRDRPRSVTLDTISAETGLNKAWLADFMTYAERDHGVNKVEALYFYFTRRDLLDDSSK